MSSDSGTTPHESSLPQNAQKLAIGVDNATANQPRTRRLVQRPFRDLSRGLLSEIFITRSRPMLERLARATTKIIAPPGGSFVIPSLPTQIGRGDVDRDHEAVSPLVFKGLVA